METIVNRLEKSPLQIFDLEDYYPEGLRVGLDLSQWLHEGLLLKEKDFRKSLENHNWDQYKDAYVAIYCATDAILPAWAKILVASHLQPLAKKVISGKLSDIDLILFIEILDKIDYSKYKNKPVILKGCSKKPVPELAYILALQHLQNVAKSIMFGEACAAVPIFKVDKNP
jgi:hypothetical protein